MSGRRTGAVLTKPLPALREQIDGAATSCIDESCLCDGDGEGVSGLIPSSIGVLGLSLSPKRSVSPNTPFASPMSQGEAISIKGSKYEISGRRPQVGTFGVGEPGAESGAESDS